MPSSSDCVDIERYCASSRIEFGAGSLSDSPRPKVTSSWIFGNYPNEYVGYIEPEAKARVPSARNRDSHPFNVAQGWARRHAPSLRVECRKSARPASHPVCPCLTGRCKGDSIGAQKLTSCRGILWRHPRASCNDRRPSVQRQSSFRSR